MSKPIINVMNIDETPKGRKGLQKMLERINDMDCDTSHRHEKDNSDNVYFLDDRVVVSDSIKNMSRQERRDLIKKLEVEAAAEKKRIESQMK